MRIFLLTICLIAVTAGAQSAWYDNAQWYDQFYQYRIPIEVSPSSAGLQILDISSDTITDAVNQLEEIKYSAKYFDHNQVIIVEYDASGGIVDRLDTGGFFLSADSSPELVYNGSFELVTGSLPTGWATNAPADFSVVSGQARDGGNCVRIRSDQVTLHSLYQTPLSMDGGSFYLLSYWSKATQNTYNPSVQFTTTQSTSGPAREMSYMPVLNSKYWAQYEGLIYEENAIDLIVVIYRSITGEAFIDDVSVKKARIDLVLDVATPGPKKYMLYYQPSEAGKRFVPEKRIPAAPALVTGPSYVGAAQRLDSITKYSVASNSDYDIWFAETTRKITPNLQAPASSKPVIQISCARNERQSFQLVLDAKNDLTISDVSLSGLSTGTDTVTAAANYLKIIDYVDMSSQSTDAHSYIPRLPDMMVPFSAQTLDTGSDNLVLWFTVIVDSGTAPGTYAGAISVSGSTGSGPFTELIPVELKVHKFALPTLAPFQVAHGGATFAGSFGGGTNIYAFHGVTTDADEDILVRKYFDVMCENKVFPYSGTYEHGYTHLWNPPPQGYNIDGPGNFFYLYDWDFADWNAELAYYAQKNWQNSLRIGHTNGTVINRFNLPGLTVEWGNPGTVYTEITMLQFDNLILDYYREVAIQLILNGWIDYAFIEVDESPPTTYPKIKHFCDVLAGDLFTSQIKIELDIDKAAAYTWKEFPDTETEISFKDRLDVWVPANNERNNYYEEYFFTEHNMDPRQVENWRYYTQSACLNIDSRGMNNRAIPVRNFFQHSTGYLYWASFIYDDPTRGIQNPRIDPYSPWGNGAVSYFYPPSDTLPAAPDFTVTPSVRLEIMREGIDDYEYLLLLDQWSDTAAATGVDTSTAVYLRGQMQRMFPHPARWSVNDEYYLLLREQIADEIDKLMWYSIYGEPATEIATFTRTGNDVRISLYASGMYRYNLLRSTDLAHPVWQLVDSALVTSGDTITLTDSGSAGAPIAFYKIEADIP